MSQEYHYPLNNPNDLAANRGGRVSTPQIEGYQRSSKPLTFARFTFTYLLLVAGGMCLILFIGVDRFGALNILNVLVGLLILAFLGTLSIFLVAVIRNQLIKGKLSEGKVSSLEGKVKWNGRVMSAITETGTLHSIFGEDLNLLPGQYRFHILSNTNFLISAEAIKVNIVPEGASTLDHFTINKSSDLLSILARGHRFDIKSLDYNRKGKLSPSQLMKLSIKTTGYALGAILITAVAIWLNQYLVRHENSSSFLILAFAGVGLWFFARQIYHLINLRKTRVDYFEGAVNKSKEINTSGGHYEKVYYYTASTPIKILMNNTMADNPSTDKHLEFRSYSIMPLSWRVSKRAYNALVEGIPYRLYYITRGNVLLAIEPLKKE